MAHVNQLTEEIKSINVRFPVELAERVKQAALDDRRSLNAEILALIEEALKSKIALPARDEAIERIREALAERMAQILHQDGDTI